MMSVEYRKNQIFLRLTNICFAAYILPLVEFSGAAILVTFLYLALEFGMYLPTWSKVLLSLTFLLAAAVVLVILDMGSRPILMSVKILEKWRLLHLKCRCKWIRKFQRSCPKIGMRIGSFHALDRSRAPNLMRFVLQRTFFLVKSTGNSYAASFTFPT